MSRAVVKAAGSNGHRARPEAPPPVDNGSAPARSRRRSGTRPPTQIVQEAAAILEKEIAAGIVAAQKVEERFVNVKELRTNEPDALMQRFRKDAHDIVDIIVDLVQVAVGSAAGLTQRGLPFRLGTSTNGNGGERLSLPPMTVVNIPEPILPGGSGEAQISVENEGDEATAALKFHVADLVSAAGASIAAGNVKFTPGSVVIQPRTAARVAIAVTVPKGVAPGTYSGIIQATNLDRVRAVLQLQVTDRPPAERASTPQA
jgi:hypothetical protein